MPARRSTRYSSRARARTRATVTSRDRGSDSDSEEIEHTAGSRSSNDDREEEEEVEEESSEDISEEFGTDSAPDDEDYVEPSVARKRKHSAQRRRKPRSLKKMKRFADTRPSSTRMVEEVRREQENFLEMYKQFQPTDLFDILSSSEDVSIDEVIREFLERYNEDRDGIIANFINLLLDCCGAMTHVEPHDVHSNETANDTIGEIQLAFQRQKIHEFHLLVSKRNRRRAQFKPLYTNFVEFMTRFLDVANDLQLLYAESEDSDDPEVNMGPLLLDLLTWLSSLSVCKIRCFRYVSTLTLYAFQDYLSKLAVDLERNFVAKLSKQLAMEQHKKRPNKKTLEKLQVNLHEAENNKAVIENVIDNIVKLCFAHRFKDVDDLIRSESVSHLAMWVRNNPEYFMKVTFLKYFGWLLSDTSGTVRLQVLRTLPDVIRAGHSSSMVDNSAIRQFSERFKERIIEIAAKDIDTEVRINAVLVLMEILSLGYLENFEILAISSLIFVEEDIGIASHSKNARLLATAAKFLAQVNVEQYNAFMANDDVSDTSPTDDIASIIRIGIFVRTLNTSLMYYLASDNKDNNNNSNTESSKSSTDSTSVKLRMLFQAGEFLYPFFASQIENMCQLLSKDDVQYNKLIEQVKAISRDVEDNIDSTEFDVVGDERSDTENFGSTPLLPSGHDNVLLYATILNGLCHGGMSTKGSSRQVVCDAVLPHLEKLLKAVSSDSMDIFLQVLDIFNLFEYDDWVRAGNEGSLKTINSAILQSFNGTNLLSVSDGDIKFDIFSRTIQRIKSFNMSELDEQWINLVSVTTLQLNKYLKDSDNDQDFMEVTDTLYSNYFNRLVILGKEYSIEFDKDLVLLIFDKYVSKVIMEVDTVGYIPNVQNIHFKLMVLLVTWTLQNWVDLLQQHSSISSALHKQNGVAEGSSETGKKPMTPDVSAISTGTIGKKMECIGIILNNMRKFLNQLRSVNHSDLRSTYYLKWCVANAIIDITVSLRSFELQLPDNETASTWKEVWRDYFPDYLTEVDLENFLEIFVFLEGLYAEGRGLSLDRLAGETINFGGDEDEDGIEHDIKTNLWKSPDVLEKNLLFFSIKLLGISRLGLSIDRKIVSRLALNREKLGPMFQKVIDGSIFEDDSMSAKKKPLNRQGIVTETAGQPTGTNAGGPPSEPVLEKTRDFVVNGSNRDTQRNLDVIEEGSDDSVDHENTATSPRTRALSFDSEI